MVYQAKQKTRAFHTQVNNAAFSNYNSVIEGCDVLSVVGMQIEINDGKVFFQGINTEVFTDTVTIDNGHADYPRIDLIAFDGFNLIVMKGTPEAYPYPPDYNPASYVILHQVYIEANETSLETTDIMDLRVLTAEFAMTALGRYVVTGITSETSLPIEHNLDDNMPVLFAYDSSGNMIIPETINVVDENNLVVTFNPAFSGNIAVIGGSFIGGGPSSTGLIIQEQDGSPYVTNVNRIKVSNGSLVDEGSGVVSLEVSNTYIHTQAVSLTTWVVTHNLGQQVVSVQCYDNADKWVQPHEIELNNGNQCTISFLSSTSGKAIIKK